MASQNLRFPRKWVDKIAYREAVTCRMPKVCLKYKTDETSPMFQVDKTGTVQFYKILLKVKLFWLTVTAVQ